MGSEILSIDDIRRFVEMVVRRHNPNEPLQILAVLGVGSGADAKLKYSAMRSSECYRRVVLKAPFRGYLVLETKLPYDRPDGTYVELIAFAEMPSALDMVARIENVITRFMFQWTPPETNPYEHVNEDLGVMVRRMQEIGPCKLEFCVEHGVQFWYVMKHENKQYICVGAGPRPELALKNALSQDIA